MRNLSLRTLILALILGAVVALSGCNTASTKSSEQDADKPEAVYVVGSERGTILSTNDEEDDLLIIIPAGKGWDDKILAKTHFGLFDSDPSATKEYKLRYYDGEEENPTLVGTRYRTGEEEN